MHNPAEAPSLTTLTVGHVTQDRYGEKLIAGGAAYYATRTFHGLGARARMVTSVGRDFTQLDVLDGLDVVRGEGDETTRFTNEYGQDGSVVRWVSGVGEPLMPSMVPDAWDDPDVLLLAPVIGELDVGSWLEQVKARQVGAGLQGFLRGIGTARGPSGPHRVETRVPTFGLTELEGLDVVFLSEQDLDEVARQGLIEKLRRVVPTVVLTRGERGCEIWHRGEVLGVGVYSTTESDPTGAGDVFAAAYLWSAACGAAPTDAARFGAAAASVVVEGQAGSQLGRVAEAFERVHHVPVACR